MNSTLYFFIALTLSLIDSAFDISLKYTFFSYILAYSYIYLFVYSFLYVCFVIILLLFVLVSTDQLVKSRIFPKLV